MRSESNEGTGSIKAIDAVSIHRISSGQVVVDLQTAVKELVENSLDAGATNIEVRFKDYGTESIEVVDNGSGIAAADYDSVGLKHHTSKLETFEDLGSVATFGFRGEALSSLCALCASVTVTTATEQDAPMGTILELDRLGKVASRSGKAARQRGTTVTITELFKPLPVRRKEFVRNAKREFGKALNLLNAYALLPCAKENGGVRLTCTHQPKGGKKSVQLRTDGSTSVRASVSALWGPKTLENLVELDLSFAVEMDRSVLRRQGLLPSEARKNLISVRGLISKFALNCGRNGSDRQFYFINGRPCNPSKAQKAFNEVYKTFNATQSPMVIADFILPEGSIDVNVSPDKRTILIHSEDNLIQALKAALEERFAPERSTYSVTSVQSKAASESTPSATTKNTASSSQQRAPLFQPDSESSGDEQDGNASKSRIVDNTGFGTPTLLVPDVLEDVDMDQPMRLDKSPDDTDPPSETRTHHGRSDSAAMDEDDDEISSTSAPDTRAERSLVTRPISPIVTQMIPPSNHSMTERDRTSLAPVAKAASKPAERQIQQIQAPRASSSHRARSNGSQLVLSTAGASWNLRPPSPSQSDPSPDTRPRKRVRVDDDQDVPIRSSNVVITHKIAQKGFKLRMAGYAMPGSQAVADGSSSDESGEDGEHASGAQERALDAVRKPDSGDVSTVASSSAVHPASLSPDKISTNLGEVIDTEASVDAGVIRPAAVRRRPDKTARVGVGNSEIPSSEVASSITPEYVRSTPLHTSEVHFDEQTLIQRWANCHIAASTARSDAHGHTSSAQTDCDDAEATETLSRVINKGDFANMEVVGQFNLGFIIARRRHTGSSTVSDDSSQETAGLQSSKDDLFIIDQHAADEKYNFEQLQLTTKIESQALFKPKPLELTAADELLAIDNIDVLRRNGFEMEIDDSPPDGGHRLKLLAQPVSKATVFDMRDLEELLHLLRDSPRGQMVRCSKARAMFAMRACRKSIMVGMPLQAKQMTSVVRHMGTMDQPWNCPHGRPTMRHLADIVHGGRRHLEDKHIRWKEFQ